MLQFFCTFRDDESDYEPVAPVNPSFIEVLKEKIAPIWKNHYHIILLVAILVIVALLAFSITGIVFHMAHSKRISAIESTMSFLMDMQQPAQSKLVSYYSRK